MSVSLEVMDSLNTMSFLNAYRRFVATRGRPSLILSDNGSQFRLAGKVFEAAWSEMSNDKEFLEYFAREQTSWRYLTALSPWKGGLYERLVALVKGAFKRTLGRSTLAIDDLFGPVDRHVAEIEGCSNE